MRPLAFLGRLFRRRRKSVVAPLTPADLLARALGHGLAQLGGESAVTASELPPTQITSALRAESAGVLTAYLLDTDRWALWFLYPDRWLLRAAGHGSRVSAADAAQDPGPLLDTLEEALPRLASFDLDLPALKVLRLRMRYGPEDLGALAWRSHDTTAWRLRTPAPGPLVFLPKERANALRDALGNPAIERVVQERVLSPGGAAAPPAAPSSLTLESPRELVASRYLLPARVDCGGHAAQVRPRCLSVGSSRAELGSGYGLWMTARCLFSVPPAAPRTWAVSYFLRLDTAARVQALTEPLRQLLACEVRETVRILAAIPGLTAGKPSLAPSLPPDPAKRGSYLVMETTLTVSSLTLPCEVWIPAPTVGALCATLVDPWDLRQAQAQRAALLCALLALNQTLLRTEVGRLHLDVLQPRTARAQDAPVFPFPAFVELAGDHDVRLVLQNHVLHNLGSRPLRSLFSYTEPGPRTVTPIAVDERRLLGFLPGPAAARWEQPAGSLPTQEAHLALNAQIMRGIRSAAHRKQLVLSQRALAILDTMFYPTVRALAQKTLDELRAARLPFSEIEKLPRPRVQELFSRTPARTLALSLVGSGPDLGSGPHARLPTRAPDLGMRLVRANTSRAKAAEIGHDHARLEREVAEGSLDLEEIVGVIRQLAEEAQRIRRADQAQETRRRVSGADGRGP